MGYFSLSTAVVILAVAILQNSVAEDVKLENSAKAHPPMTGFRKPTATPVTGNELAVPVYHKQAGGKGPPRIYTNPIRVTRPVPVGPRLTHIRKRNNSNQINMKSPKGSNKYHTPTKLKRASRPVPVGPRKRNHFHQLYKKSLQRDNKSDTFTKLKRASRPVPVGPRKRNHFHQLYKKSLKRNNKFHTFTKLKRATRPVPVGPRLTHLRKRNHFNQINKKSPKQSNKPARKPLKHPYPGGNQSKQQNLKPIATQPPKVPKKTTSVTAIATKDGASVSALAD